MGTAILVRHGDIDRDPAKNDVTDDLTCTAKKFAKRLPDLLSQKGFPPSKIDLVYYDSSKKHVPDCNKDMEIQRCKVTVEYFDESKQVPYCSNEICSKVIWNEI